MKVSMTDLLILVAVLLSSCAILSSSYLTYSLRHVHGKKYTPQRWLSTTSNVAVLPEDQNVTGNTSYMTCDLPDDKIMLVDSMHSLVQMKRILIDEVLNDACGDRSNNVYNIVAIDCEWKPESKYSKSDHQYKQNDTALQFPTGNAPTSRLDSSINIEHRIPSDIKSDGMIESNKTNKRDSKVVTPPSPVALLQLSTRHHVFIVDLLVLCQDSNQSSISSSNVTATEAALDDVFSIVFQSEKVIKLGLGLAQDLKRLAWSYPCIQSFSNVTNVIDIQTLAKKVYPTIATRDFEGLSKLCVRFIGLPVDKAMQCSNWDQRPLSQQQLMYAIIDSYVLIKLYDKIIEVAHAIPTIKLRSIIPSISHQYIAGLATKGSTSSSSRSSSNDQSTLRSFPFQQTSWKLRL